jgi:hypothetical protein
MTLLFQNLVFIFVRIDNVSEKSRKYFKFMLNIEHRLSKINPLKIYETKNLWNAGCGKYPPSIDFTT